MRVGSLVFATDQGLGILAKDFYDHGVVTDVLVIRHGRHPEHDRWYPNAPRIGNLNGREELTQMRAFVRSMDAMLFFETPFRWDLLADCKRSFLMPMYECMPDPLPAYPDKMICPSLLDLRYAQQAIPFGYVNSTFIPVPVPDSIKWKLRTRAEVFVHNAGHGGLCGRNGTKELIEAFPLIKSPIKLIIRGQSLRDLPVMRSDSGKTVIAEGSVEYSELFRDGDVFVFPEKFNGLSLPLQEARASGMLVMATDRFPMNTWLPREPLIPTSGSIRSRVSPRCAEFDEAVIDPRDIAAKIDEWYGRDITEYSKLGSEWALMNSWEVLRSQYMEELQR